jgi:hypothetical protein
MIIQIDHFQGITIAMDVAMCVRFIHNSSCSPQRPWIAQEHDSHRLTLLLPIEPKNNLVYSKNENKKPLHTLHYLEYAKTQN